MVHIYVTTIAVILYASVGFSAEVKNVVVKQDGQELLFKYDLTGNDTSAEISLKVHVKDKMYQADDLNIDGDVGKGVKPGTGKKITWHVLMDFENGLSGSVQWEIKNLTKKSSKGKKEELPKKKEHKSLNEAEEPSFMFTF